MTPLEQDIAQALPPRLADWQVIADPPRVVEFRNDKVGRIYPYDQYGNRVLRKRESTRTARPAACPVGEWRKAWGKPEKLAELVLVYGSEREISSHTAAVAVNRTTQEQNCEFDDYSAINGAVESFEQSDEELYDQQTKVRNTAAACVSPDAMTNSAGVASKVGGCPAASVRGNANMSQLCRLKRSLMPTVTSMMSNNG